MRKTTAVLLLIGAIVGSLVAPADAGKKKKKPREAVVTYASPAIGSADATGTCPDGCPTFGVAATERYLTLKIEDDSGLAPAATIGQDSDPNDNFVDRIGEVCGETEAAIPVVPGAQVVVWVWATPRLVAGGGPCLGAGTSGTITATFSNLP
ncbi:MAG: hypothetical protein ACRDJI_01075 [Actinomycetota bacterium]